MIVHQVFCELVFLQYTDIVIDATTGLPREPAENLVTIQL